MPSGRTHDRITLWTLPLVASVTLALTRQSPFTLSLCAGFLFGGLMLGPDLDIHSVHYKRWGWLRWIWLPYRGSLKHRSPFSHAPITGTVLRVVYLLAWLALFGLGLIAIVNELWQMGWTWGQIGQVMQQGIVGYRWELLGFAIGLEVGAFSHYTADWSLSTYKQVKKKGWQAVFAGKKKRGSRGAGAGEREAEAVGSG
ncbi:metal-binding protein [Leptolyngbya ohadii]|uniref:metal-binding protein n=1 Tax=Leptolyngbya ohadii TaxID=1962290 RepID=UPI000B59983F|nr:metal-binding protein [Leptolyngbya ohadii]